MYILHSKFHFTNNYCTLAVIVCFLFGSNNLISQSDYTNKCKLNFSVIDSNFKATNNSFNLDCSYNNNDRFFYYIPSKIKLGSRINFIDFLKKDTFSYGIVFSDKLISFFSDFHNKIKCVYSEDSMLYLMVGKQIVYLVLKNQKMQYYKTVNLNKYYDSFTKRNNEFYFVNSKFTGSNKKISIDKMNLNFQVIKNYSQEILCFSLSAFEPNNIIDFGKNYILISEFVDYKVKVIDYDFKVLLTIEKPKFRSISKNELDTIGYYSKISKFDSQRLFDYLTPKWERTLSRIENIRFINDSSFQVVYFTKELYNPNGFERNIDLWSIKNKSYSPINMKLDLIYSGENNSPENSLSINLILNFISITNNMIITQSITNLEKKQILQFSFYDFKI